MIAAHVQFLHSHGIEHMPQKFVGVLLPEIHVLIVFTTYRGQKLSVRYSVGDPERSEFEFNTYLGLMDSRL